MSDWLLLMTPDDERREEYGLDASLRLRTERMRMRRDVLEGQGIDDAQAQPRRRLERRRDAGEIGFVLTAILLTVMDGIAVKD